MDCDRVSITIEDDEIWEQRRARLRALDSVIKSSQQAEFTRRVNPLLHDAVKEGHVDRFIEALENYSAKERVSLSDIIDTRGPSGNSLLHVAAGAKNADILRALLEVIPDKQLAAEVNYRGDTTLHVAARAGRIYQAELLLGCERIVHMVNDAGNTALHEAVKKGDAGLTRLLLSRGSRAVYPENKESKCPLYLAVETGNLEILKLLMKAMDENEIPWSRMQGMSPVHGAVIHQRLDEDMMKEISIRDKTLFNLRDARNGTPLHLAAHENYVNGVKLLVKHFGSSLFECDAEGYLPIHVACKMGHLDTIKELLGHWPHPEELLTSEEGQNILHVAAKYGMAEVVNHVLGEAEHEKLINAKDKEGNTPLHVATLQWQPEVLLYLTQDKRVDLKLENNRNLTALDIVDEQLKEADAPLRQSLTRIILKSAKVPRSKDRTIRGRLDPGRDMKPLNLDRLKTAAETRMVVATLVAAMTFAAGFSVPGGYNSSNPNAGIAMLLDKPMYDVFVICNTVAMYSSIITVVILLWTQINDAHAMYRAIRYARLPLLIALATMSMAFSAGVYVTISRQTWIAVVALIIGITGLFVISGLYIPMFIPLVDNCRLVQFFTDYIIKVAISISRSKGRAIPPAQFGDPDTELEAPRPAHGKTADELRADNKPEALRRTYTFRSRESPINCIVMSAQSPAETDGSADAGNSSSADAETGESKKG